MKAVKILQVAIVVMFVAMVVTGILVLATAPDKMDAFKSLVWTVFPVFLTMVVPALIGSPLTDYIRAKAAALGPGTPLPADAPVDSANGKGPTLTAIPPPAVAQAGGSQ